MNKQNTTQNVEAGLSTLYQPAMPDAAFVNRLEQQFQGQRKGTSALLFSRRQRMRIMPNWATVATLVFLFALISVVAIGPQRVWAEVLGLISFIPGVGITNIDEARLMVAPVTVIDDQLELIVDSVAVTENTEIKYTIRGLPAMAPRPLDRRIDMRGISFYLQLPNGEILEPYDFFIPAYTAEYLFRSSLIFPRLPEGITNVKLVLVAESDVAVLPIGSEGLTADIELLSASDESIALRFPEPQILEGISTSYQGITMKVNQAIYGEDHIAVEVSFLNNSPWKLNWGRPSYLFDDIPTSYDWQEIGLGVNATVPYRDPENRIDMVYSFKPGISEDASSLTLGIDAVLVFTDTAPLPIRWNLKFDATDSLTQTWPLDIKFEVAGFSYGIVSARWLERPEIGPDWSPNDDLWWDPNDHETRYLLEVETIAPSWQGDIQPSGVPMESENEFFTYAMFTGDEDRSGQMYNIHYLGFSDLPDGEIMITIPKAYFLINGSWRVEWDVVHPE